MRTRISSLDHTGHSAITWDDTNPEEAQAARAMVASLKAHGYKFFLADGVTVADEVTAGGGTLLVRRITVEELLPEVSSPGEGLDTPLTPSEKPRRGRRKATPQPERQVVAVQQMRGG